MAKVKISKEYFKTEQIETFIGFGKDGSSLTDESQLIGERRKLIVLHQNGENKKQLIEQLKTLIHGIETGFEGFVG